MYRDEPLDDEADLRQLVGDEAVDALAAVAGLAGVGAAIDLLREFMAEELGTASRLGAAAASLSRG